MSGGSSFFSDTLGNIFSSSNSAPTKADFTTYGDFGATSAQDAMRFRGQGDRRFGSTPGKVSPSLDVPSYEKAYNRWSLIENERRKRLNYALGLAGGLGKSGGSSVSGGGGGGGAGKVGGGGRQTQMASMGVSDKPEDPFRKLEDFYPFMKNYRIT